MSETMAFLLVIAAIIGIGGITWNWIGRTERPLAADASIDWPPGWENRAIDRVARLGPVLIVLAIFGGIFAGVWYSLLPTKGDVIELHVDRIDDMVRRFDRISEQLPAPGVWQAGDSTLKLDPPPIYDRARGVFNTEFISGGELAQPSNYGSGAGAFYLGGDLARYVGLRHSSPYYLSDKAPGDFSASVDNALNYRYLVVVQTIAPDDFEAFLFDLDSTELILGVRFSGSYTSARNELLRKLRTQTNGVFVAN